MTASAAASLDPLRRVLSELPVDLDAAMLVVQHRAATCGTLFARMLRAVTPLRVVSVEGRETIRPGTVYVLPPDRVSRVDERGIDVAARHGHRRQSSVEPVVESAVAVYGPDIVALLLAGDCGWTAASLASIHRSGGIVLTQAGHALAKKTRPAPVDPGLRIHERPLSEISYFLRRLVTAGASRQWLTGAS